MTSTTTPSRAYTVVGGGAIGGTLAWHLARAGHPVHIVDADADHVAAIAAHGLVLQRDGKRSAQPVPASLPGDVAGPLHRVLLAVKAHATDTAAGWIAPRLAADGFVVSLQNGLNEDVIAGHVGAPRTVGAFVDLFADVIEPGVIADGGAGALAVGEMDGTVSDRVREVAADLSVWGPAQVTTNVTGFLWAKLAFGAMLAATAVADASMAELVDRHRAMGYSLAGEILALADRLRIAPEPFDAFEPQAYLPGADPAVRDAATDRLVAWLGTQSKTRSGIWRDIAVRQRPTEIPNHYQPVVRLARSNGVEVPVLEAMLEQLSQVEADPSSMDEARLHILDRVARSAAAS